MPGRKGKSGLTEFGIQLDRLLAKLKEPMTIADYTDLTGLSYKYISQLRTKPERRPGSYAIVKLLKPFVDFELLTLDEALQFSKVTRGKVLTIGECKSLFPAIREKELRLAISEALQTGGHDSIEPAEIMIIENDYSVPIPVIDFIKRESPQVVKMLEHSGTYGRRYIDVIKSLDSKIKEVRLLIHNPFEHMISDLQRERACEQIRTLKLVDFEGDVLKIRCYNRPASLRGRKFDNELVILGWYTYYYDPNFPEYGKNQIWGHNNPLVVSRLRNQGKYLGELFDRCFNFLWDDPGSISLLTVCTKRCNLCQDGGKSAGNKEGCFVSEEWLRKVSG